MEYKLVNPSDPYTFVADDLETAALVVFILGTAYEAKTKRGEIAVPVLFGSAEEWYAEQFGRNVEEGITAKKEQLVAALNSMTLGDFEDR